MFCIKNIFFRSFTCNMLQKLDFLTTKTLSSWLVAGGLLSITTVFLLMSVSSICTRGSSRYQRCWGIFLRKIKSTLTECFFIRRHCSSHFIIRLISLLKKLTILTKNLFIILKNICQNYMIPNGCKFSKSLHFFLNLSN